jgi:eukaryotic-like serine/threonine-protein kinase
LAKSRYNLKNQIATKQVLNYTLERHSCNSLNFPFRNYTSERILVTSEQRSPGSDENQLAVNTSGGTAVATALSVRLWTYDPGENKLHDFTWTPEGVVADLLSTFIYDRSGKIVGAQQNILLAQFSQPLEAISAAKSLQERLRTFNLNPSVQRIVAAVAVHSWLSEAVAALTEIVAPQIVVSRRLLSVCSPLQVLVTKGIYDLAKNIPGFEFGQEPVAGLEEAGIPGQMYELIWTDAESYVAAGAAIVQKEALEPANTRYTIQGEIGRGSMGVVYKAYDNLIGRTVALKTISFDSNEMNRGELIERLRQEAKAAGSLDHPNIITIYDVAQEKDLIYLSMQFVEGTTLASLVAERKLLSLESLLSYIDQICSAVTFAHDRGVIHRDLKPSNLMLTDQGLIKILDFGIAKLGDAGLTQAGMVIGTPDYMAPEQAAGRGVDHRSDIFALGAVFYELFTGEKTFDGQSITSVIYKVMNEDPIPPSAIDPLLPRSIDVILQRALAKDPAQRFQSCAEMRDAFRQQAALAAPGAQPVNSTPSASPVSFISKFVPRHFRHIKYVVWSGIAIGVLAVAMLIFVRKDSPPRVPASPSPNTVSNRVETTTKSPPVITAPATTILPPAAPAIAVDNDKAFSDKQNPGGPVETEVPARRVAADADSEDRPSGKTDNDAPKRRGRSSSVQKTSSASRHSSSKREAAKSSHAGNSIFDASEIPALLKEANAAAGRGDYVGAKTAFKYVLDLDKQNAAALEGLRRVQEAEKEK